MSRPLRPLWDLLAAARPNGLVARFRRWRDGRGKSAHDVMLRAVDDYVDSLPDEQTPRETPKAKRK